MTFTKEAITGAVVLLVIVAGIIFYASMRSAPSQSTPPTATATSTAAHITEHTDTYDIDAQYPSSTPLATLSTEADAAAVSVMKSWEQGTVSDFKQSFTGLDAGYLAQIKQQGLKGSLGVTYQTYQSSTTVSYAYEADEDTLGAHPNTFYKTFTFDTSTGGTLALADLFVANSNYLNTLSQDARNILPAQIAQAQDTDVSQVDMQMLDDGTAPTKPDNFANFYIDGGNLVIIFEPYAVAPYVVGTESLTLPLSGIPGVKPQYLQ